MARVGNRHGRRCHRRWVVADEARDDEEAMLRSVALQNASAILSARGRAEQEVRAAKDALQARERELSLIYRNVSDVIFYVGAEPEGRFRFLSVNRALL